jgi:hypothetical protein
MPVTCFRIIALLCALSLLVGTTACTSMRAVADRTDTPATLPGALNQLVAPGDQVEVTTTDGRRIALTVTAVTADALEGSVDAAAEATRVPVERIARIERREKDGAKTAALVVGITVCVLIVLYALVSSIVVMPAMAP